ncbi:MAG: cell division protein FtsA [Patescibacteria group bacterium]|nr:cell division protein FtsA [Patescibacteria group bacterium]
MKNDIIVGLDIGSSAIKLVIAQKKFDFNEEKIHVIGAVSHPSSGIGKNGVVNSIEDAVSSLSACLEKAERLVGIPISSVFLSFNHSKIRYERVKGVAIISKNDGEIDQSDIDRAIDSAKSFPVPNNYEIFKTFPVKYNIDNNEDVKDPIGMRGIRLEVEVLVSMVLSSQMNNLVKVVQRVGLGIDDVSFPSITMAELFLTSKEIELGVAVVDIGATTTSLAVYEDGVLIHFNTLPIGSEYITADIALGLKCPITLAEKIKLEFGDSDSNSPNIKEDIDISSLLKEERIEDENNIVSRKYLSEIIEARVEEIFKLVDEEFKKVNRSKILPVGVFLSGGGSLLKNISKTAKKTLSLPVAFLEPKYIKIEVDKANRPDFLTALSLAVYGCYSSFDHRGNNIIKDNFKDLFSKAQNLFKKIMPK